MKQESGMKIQLSALSSVRMPFKTSQFRGMSTRTKLWGSFGLMLVLMVMMGVLGIVQTSNSSRIVNEVAVIQTQKTSLVLEWKGLATANGGRISAIALSNDILVKTLFKNDIEDTSKRIDEIVQLFNKLPLTTKEHETVKKLDMLMEKLNSSAKEMTKLWLSNDVESVVAEYSSIFTPTLKEYLAILDAFNTEQEKNRTTQLVRLGEAQSAAVAAFITITFIALLIGLVFAWTITRSILLPLNQALSLADRVAAGDLTEATGSDRKDEFGTLIRSLGKMTQSLRNIVHNVRDSSDHIRSASQEIATGNSDLSYRTESQAANLQMTASSVEELTATVTQSADTARQASQLAASASEVARRGGSVVSDVVNTMGEITASSKKISEIIGVIDGIAFQTNILALNAAVEAARAGDQGRGFAVVAGEVRALAQRSASAAKEIKELINASVAKIRSGSDLVQTAGETMTEIVESVQRVTDLIGDISAATTEQSSGISEVNTAISQLDQMTQQNAALVEQSSSASMSLREEAAKLSESVSVFRIDKA
jgi:methyl-accepting chemotaxis protein